MYHNSQYSSFWVTHKVCLMSLLFTNVIAQDTLSVLKDNSRVLLCEHGASAIVSFTWTKGYSAIIQGFITNGQMTIVIDSMSDKTEVLLQDGSPNMRLDNIDISDEGTYTCTAVEQGGAQTVLTSELLVRVQPSAPDVQVQYDPQPSDMSAVPLNTTVTFTCSSTGGRPPATLTWTGAPVNPTYTSSNNSQGVGDATSMFNFTTTTYGATYRVQCTASGPDPIQTRTSAITSFTTEKVQMVIAQDTVSVIKDNSRVLLCEHGTSAIASFTWKKGGTVLIQGIISNGQPIVAVDSMPDKTELLLQNGSPNMRLDNIDFSDEGTYSCEATEQGTGQLTVLTSELLVRVQPSAPVIQVQFDPQPADMSAVPLNTTVTFTCSSTGGRPPASLSWSGIPVSVNPTYTASNDSQGVGDATSTFNFTTTTYGMTYGVQCTASGPDPIQTRTSAITSFTTEPVVTSAPNTASKSSGPEVSSAPQTEGNCSGPGVIAGAAVGCFIGGLLVGGAAVLLFLRFRTVKNSGAKKDTRDPAERQYENVAPPRATSQRPGSGSDEYEVPMETIQPPPQPPQPGDDYQELRPAIYQSLKKH